MGMAEELGNLAMAALDDMGVDAPAAPPPPPLKPLVRRCHLLLHRRMRVGVSDGRVFVGKFHCLDKQGNIILYDAIEYRDTDSPPSSSFAAPLPPPSEQQRSLGLVLIPLRCRTSCLVEGTLDEQLSLLSLQED